MENFDKMLFNKKQNQMNKHFISYSTLLFFIIFQQFIINSSSNDPNPTSRKLFGSGNFGLPENPSTFLTIVMWS